MLKIKNLDNNISFFDMAKGSEIFITLNVFTKKNFPKSLKKLIEKRFFQE